MTQEQVVRTYSGRTREAAEHAYRADAARALAGGYTPLSHRWTQDARGLTLMVAYRPLTIEPDYRAPAAEAAVETPVEVAVEAEVEEMAEVAVEAEGEALAEVAVEAEGEALAEPELPETMAEVEEMAEPELPETLAEFDAMAPVEVIAELDAHANGYAEMNEFEPAVAVEDEAVELEEPAMLAEEYVLVEDVVAADEVVAAELTAEPDALGEVEATRIRRKVRDPRRRGRGWRGRKADAKAVEPDHETVAEVEVPSFDDELAEMGAEDDEEAQPIEWPAEQNATVEEAPALPTGRSARLTVQVLDLHCAGEPLRMIRSGFPDVPNMPVLERRRWVAENADEIRRAIVFEPRGHSDMYGAILLPPHSPEADICLLFMHNEGYSTMCGHGVIAVTTALIEEGLFPATAPTTTIRFEVPAGIVTATASTAQLEDGSFAVSGVSFSNVPSYLAARSLAIAPDGVELHGPAARDGYLTVDLAFGGAYYGVVGAGSLGLRVVPEHASALRRAGAAITEVLRRDHTPTHPTDPDLGFVYGTIIVDRDPGSSPDGRATNAHWRNVTIFADAELDRSPCGSGTSALLAHLYFRGHIGLGEEFINAGITGEAFVGYVLGETDLGGEPAVMTSVSGRAFVTGYSTLVVDERDPLGEGFLLR